MDSEKFGVSRVVCYKNNSSVGGARQDLMSDGFSSIWMEIGFPSKKKYRESNILDRQTEHQAAFQHS